MMSTTHSGNLLDETLRKRPKNPRVSGLFSCMIWVRATHLLAACSSRALQNHERTWQSNCANPHLAWYAVFPYSWNDLYQTKCYRTSGWREWILVEWGFWWCNTSINNYLILALSGNFRRISADELLGLEVETYYLVVGTGGSADDSFGAWKGPFESDLKSYTLDSWRILPLPFFFLSCFIFWFLCHDTTFFS